MAPTVRPASEPIAARLARRIAAEGPLPVSAVVGVALYDPDGGFYTTTGRAGRRGDFLTSAEVGPLFGATLARGLDRWWLELGRPAPFVVVEHGAGPGTLARAVLAAADRCAGALRYVAVEVSPPQRAQHPAGVETSGEPPPGPITGVVLANELVDNLPVDLARRTAAGWVEITVGLDAVGRLVEVDATLPADDVALLERLAPAARPGAEVPLHRAARRWLADRLAELRAGRLVLIDYTATTAELARRARTEWLRTYRGHERGGAMLDDLGHQDITCEVALDQLAEVAEPATVADQATYLRQLGIDELVAEGRRRWAERSAVGDLVALAARSRVREAEALLDPAGLGGFTVAEWIVTGR